MIVIASDTELAIGEQRVGRVSDASAEWQDVAFVVIKEVTEDEYISAAIENGASALNVALPFVSPRRFYAVAMD